MNLQYESQEVFTALGHRLAGFLDYTPVARDPYSVCDIAVYLIH